MTCEFCGITGDTRLLWSDEHGRKVRCCRLLAPCLDRVLAPAFAACGTSEHSDRLITREALDA